MDKSVVIWFKQEREIDALLAAGDRFRVAIAFKNPDKLARRIGLAARLGFAITASAVGELPLYALRMTGNRVLLDVARRREAIAGEPVQKRLGALAQALGKKGEIVVG